jgi:hypothetical protein
MLMLTFWMLWTRRVQEKEDAEEQESQDKGQGVAAGQS